jgi:hypothetical protein
MVQCGKGVPEGKYGAKIYFAGVVEMLKMSISEHYHHCSQEKLRAIKKRSEEAGAPAPRFPPCVGLVYRVTCSTTSCAR